MLPHWPVMLLAMLAELLMARFTLISHTPSICCVYPASESHRFSLTSGEYYLSFTSR